MFYKLKDLYGLLNKEQRIRLVRLQFLVVLMAFAEVVGVASIGPFMAAVGNMDKLEETGKLKVLFEFSGLHTPKEFLFFLGLGVLGALAISSIISMFTTWRLSLYGQQVGAELSTRLYKYYMGQPWVFHASGSSVILTNKIAQECSRVTNQVIVPFLQINAKVIMGSVMATAVFLLNPTVAVAGVSIFGIVYYLLYRIVRHKLLNNGKDLTDASRARFKLMSEGFGGVKDTLLLGRQGDFVTQFEKTSRKLGNALGTNRGIAQIPRYAVEFIAFCSIVFLVLYLLSVYDGDVGVVLPLLSVYALAGFKLLPAFQQVYSGLTSLKSNMTAFDSLRDDLEKSLHQSRSLENCESKMAVEKNIILKDVFYTYPAKKTPALKSLNIDIPVNHVIGMVGPSGSGKSTAIDVLLGLIEPEKGCLIVDDQVVENKLIRQWQNCIGYVPQSIFLADASIKENIAFGIPAENIDDERILKAIEMAHLNELLKQLPDGLNTRVGERGVQLSGGQRQRIGIARALYDDASILILDEATSALDGVTERLVMDAIHDFSGKKTIIMIAHRLATVQACDKIYVINDGEVSDCGTYDELIDRSSIFRNMANHNQ